jgi:hypothetical protein
MRERASLAHVVAVAFPTAVLVVVRVHRPGLRSHHGPAHDQAEAGHAIALGCGPPPAARPPPPPRSPDPRQPAAAAHTLPWSEGRDAVLASASPSLTHLPISLLLLLLPRQRLRNLAVCEPAAAHTHARFQRHFTPTGSGPCLPTPPSSWWALPPGQTRASAA